MKVEKVVYQEGDRVRSLMGIVRDIGWAVKVTSIKDEEIYTIINKQYLIKIVHLPAFDNGPL